MKRVSGAIFAASTLMVPMSLLAAVTVPKPVAWLWIPVAAGWAYVARLWFTEWQEWE